MRKIATMNETLESLPARRPTEVDRSIGLRIRMRRAMVHMSQEQLAAACNVSAQQIHKYERGHSSIRASRLLQISRILKTPVSFFYSGADEMNGMPPELVELLSDPDCIDALLAIRKVSDPVSRARLVDVIKVFADEDDGDAVAADDETLQSA
ncbi:MAG: helix-turn-helix transcriptional regulator [Pseudomonadota bacterium]